MAKLKKLSDFSPEEINNSRREIRNLGLLTHFAGEIAMAGFLGVAALSSLHKESFDLYLTNFLHKASWGLFFYGLAQSYALYLRGPAFTLNEHIEMAKDLKEEAQNTRKGGVIKRILHYPRVTEQFSKLHGYFAENYGRCEDYLVIYLNRRHR